MKRKMWNFLYFKEVVGENWRVAYRNFMNAKEEDSGMIIANYDNEGYCLFDKTQDAGVWEFTGTAK